LGCDAQALASPYVLSLDHHDLNAKEKVKVKHWATSILVMSEKFQKVVIL
jgi:hypothetical protein